MPKIQTMSPSAELVASGDKDRFISVVFAAPDRQEDLFALYAFNTEISKVREVTSESITGEIRLQWWRDAIEEIYNGSPRKHIVVEALARSVDANRLERRLFDELIDVRAHDLYPEPLKDVSALKTYVEKTAGHIVRLAVQTLGAGQQINCIATDAGRAWGLIGLMRALPFHASARRCFIPATIMKDAGVDLESIFAGRNSQETRAAMDVVLDLAEQNLDLARKGLALVPKPARPAFTYLAVADNYVKQMRKEGFNPFKQTVDLPSFRKQYNMFMASKRGRV